MVERLEIAKNAASADRYARKNGYSFYAGGTEICRLGSAVKNRKFVLLKNAGLAGIEKSETEFDGKKLNCVKIGSMTTFADILKSEIVPEFLKDAVRFCSSMPKRNMATIGGNVMSRRDDSYLLSVLVASRTFVEVLIGGKAKTIGIEDLLAEKDLSGILLLSVCLRTCGRKVFSKRFANTAASHASLTIAFGVCEHDGKMMHPIFSASIKGTGTIRVKCAEKLFGKGNPSSADIEQAIKNCTKLKFKSDIFGSAEYKRYLLAVACADLYRKYTDGEER